MPSICMLQTCACPLAPACSTSLFDTVAAVVSLDAGVLMHILSVTIRRLKEPIHTHIRSELQHTCMFPNYVTHDAPSYV